TIPSFFPIRSNSQSPLAAAPARTPPAPYSAPQAPSSHSPIAHLERATASALARTSETPKGPPASNNPATLPPPLLSRIRPIPAAQRSAPPSPLRAPPQTFPFPAGTPGKTQTRTRPGKIRRPARISPPILPPHRALRTPASPEGKMQTRSASRQTRALHIPAALHTAPRQSTSPPKFPTPPKSQAVSSHLFLTPLLLVCPAFKSGPYSFLHCA